MEREVRVGQVWEAHDKKDSRRKIKITGTGIYRVFGTNLMSGKRVELQRHTLRQHWQLVQEAPATPVVPVVPVSETVQQPPAVSG